MKIDPARWKNNGSDVVTGIFVRAQDPDGNWQSADIWCLEPESLLEWLRSRGGENPYAENVVGTLLGRGALIKE